MRPTGSTHPSRALELSEPDASSVTAADDGWEIDLGRLPQDAAERARVAEARLAAAVEHVSRQGGGRLRLWVRGDDAVREAAATSAGMTMVRQLHQLRRPLPVEEAWSLDVRPFVTGQDEEAWLGVNNRAFAWHPEQSDMTLADLQAREGEPWFDPAGFLLHEAGGELVGFCWTKVHSWEEPPLGEIYVIAVDPAAHKRGLGRQLVLAGLDHLHSRGMTIGMLYTESDNEPALRLYFDLGFTIYSSDQAYDLQVEPA